MKTGNIKTHKCVTLIVLLAIVLTTNMEATNGIFPTAVGTRAAGRGGVDFAIASDPTAIHTNPAGIAFIPGKMVDFNFGTLYPSVSFADALNAGADANEELMPFASFAMVWDTASQTLETPVDPFRYFFRDPDPAYANKTQGSFFFSCAQLSPKAFLLTKGMGATISNIRIYADIVNTPQKIILWQTDNFPKADKYPRLAMARLKFQYRLPQATSTEIILQMEQKQARLKLHGNGNWQDGYLVLPWSKAYTPAYLQLLTTQLHSLELREVDVSIGYGAWENYAWEKVLQKKEFAPLSPSKTKLLIARIDRSYVLQEGGSLRIALLDKVQLPEATSNLYVHYHYKFAAHIDGAYANLTLIDKDKRVASQTHQKTLWAYNVADRFITPQPPNKSGIKFGFGVIPQSGGRNDITISTDLFPEGVENYVNSMYISLVPAIAFRLHERFSFGISLNFDINIVETDGLIMQDGLEVLLGKSPFPGVTFGEALLQLFGIEKIHGEIDSDTLYGFGIGGRIGFMWKITDRLQIGAVYSPQSWMTKTKGEAMIDFSREFAREPINQLVAGFFLPNQGRFGFRSNYDIKVEMRLPHRVGGGVSYWLLDNILIGVDFQWINYAHTNDEIQLGLRNGDNVDFNAVAGSEDVDTKINVGWKDQYVVAAGIVWQPFNSLFLRGGYNYGTNPMPDNHLNPQQPVIFEHHVNFGLSYALNPHITINAAAEWALPSEVKSADENEFNTNFVDSELKASLFGGMVGISFRF